MNFREFSDKNIVIDKESKTYTRYLTYKNRKLNKIMLVSLTTNDKGAVSIRIYPTDLNSRITCAKVLDKRLVDASDREILKIVENSGDFNVDENPVCELHSTVFDKKAVIQGVDVSPKYQRKGIGSYALQLVQDYYAKTEHIGIHDTKEICASKNVENEEFVYQTKLENSLGGFGKWLAKSRSKILGNTGGIKAYIEFLKKNDFYCEANTFQLPKKNIYHKRNIISEALLDENNCPKVIQCYDEIIDIDKEKDLIINE